jgi:hypothetical protein
MDQAPGPQSRLSAQLHDAGEGMPAKEDGSIRKSYDLPGAFSDWEGI